MNPYQINMARDYVMPLESRRKWLRWFGLYLILMGGGIAVVLFRVTTAVAEWQLQRDAQAVQEARLLAAHPGQKTAAECRATLARAVVATVTNLDLVVAAEMKEVPAARLILGLTEALPAGVELNRVDFDGDGRTLDFEVVMSSDRKREDGLTPPRLVAAWEQEPLLVNVLSRIEVETSERVKINGMNMICWRFKANAGGN